MVNEPRLSGTRSPPNERAVTRTRVYFNSQSKTIVVVGTYKKFLKY